MTQIVQTMAAKHASRRIISVLEGGYNPRALADCVAAHLAQLGNYNDFL
jgi:acetoin utilization deacetylase AcuC-like enzyme